MKSLLMILYCCGLTMQSYSQGLTAMSENKAAVTNLETFSNSLRRSAAGNNTEIDFPVLSIRLDHKTSLKELYQFQRDARRQGINMNFNALSFDTTDCLVLFSISTQGRHIDKLQTVTLDLQGRTEITLSAYMVENKLTWFTEGRKAEPGVLVLTQVSGPRPL